MKRNILLLVTLVFSGYLNAASITWDTVNSNQLAAGSFSLDIVGLGFVIDVDGGGVNLSFDSSILNVTQITIDENVWDFGGLGISTGTIDNGAGTVNGIMVNTLATTVTGDFTVATVDFLVVGGVGSSSSLTMTEYDLNPWASGGSVITPSYVVGNVSVVPVPAAVWLFGSGLIGLISLARRK